MNDLQTPEYAAVRHILISPAIAARCSPHIRDDDFDWPGLIAAAETMSSGEQLLVRLAFDLWDANVTVGISEVPRRLDRANFARVVDALAIFRGDGAKAWADAA
jgi:hypothetical protein